MGGQFSSDVTRLRFDLSGDATLMAEQVNSCEKILLLEQTIQNLPRLANAHIMAFETSDRVLPCTTTTTTRTPTTRMSTTRTPTRYPTTSKPTKSSKPTKAPSSVADAQVIDDKHDDDGVKASHMEYLVIGLLSALILGVCCGALYMVRRNQVIKAQVQSVEQREATEIQNFGMTESYMADSYTMGGATYTRKQPTKPDTSLRTVQTIYPIEKRQPVASVVKRSPHSKLEAGLYGDITPRGPAGFNSLSQLPNEGKDRVVPKKATISGNSGGTKAPEDDDNYEGDLVTM